MHPQRGQGARCLWCAIKKTGCLLTLHHLEDRKPYKNKGAGTVLQEWRKWLQKRAAQHLPLPLLCIRTVEGDFISKFDTWDGKKDLADAQWMARAKGEVALLPVQKKGGLHKGKVAVEREGMDMEPKVLPRDNKAVEVQLPMANKQVLGKKQKMAAPAKAGPSRPVAA